MKLYVERIRLNQGGYDRRGRYWGTGAPLYRVSSDDGEIDKHVRAPDARAARRLIEAAVRLVDRDRTRRARNGTVARDPVVERRGNLVVRGRPYSVEAHVVPAGRPFAGEPRYTLTGKRGATYFTTRNVHRPHLMFIFSNAPRSNVLEGVWLTDEGGELRVVRQ